MPGGAWCRVCVRMWRGIGEFAWLCQMNGERVGVKWFQVSVTAATLSVREGGEYSGWKSVAVQTGMEGAWSMWKWIWPELAPIQYLGGTVSRLHHSARNTGSIRDLCHSLCGVCMLPPCRPEFLGELRFHHNDVQFSWIGHTKLPLNVREISRVNM